MLVATANSKTIKNNFKYSLLTAAANKPPNQAPKIIPGVSKKTSGHNTACFL